MATIRDVSRLAGVSVATVSRGINRSGYVKEETREAVLAAMRALDYEPSVIARGLAGKNTKTIALIIPDILNPFFPEVARAIEDQASKLNYTVILCNSDNDPEKESKYIQILKSKKIDGIIIASYTIEAPQILELQREGVPVVAVDRAFGSDPILSFICNNREGARMAARHLMERGCRKIAHISGPSVMSAKERCLGYEDVCGSEGWFDPGLIVEGNFTIEGGYAATLELFERHPDIDGIFAGNDLMAVGALKALYQLGKSVPRDVKIVGFDDIALARMVVPEITTVRQPVYEIGRQAMKHLIKLINGEKIGQKTMRLDVELVVRRSSGEAADRV